MATTMLRRIDSGAVCEKLVYNVPEGVRLPKRFDPEKVKRERFETQREYDDFKEGIARRNHARRFNAAFSPDALYSTLTFDNEWEIHTFEEAKQVRRCWTGALKRKFPDAVIFLYMGRGKATQRIHFHMVSTGIPAEFIAEKWKYGTVLRVEHLRAHNWYDGRDRGQDYTGLANYLFDHWTPEVGGHHCFMTRNAPKPQTEEPKEVRVRGGYSDKRPPKAPKGYAPVEITKNQYGYWRFVYVRTPPDGLHGSRRKKPGHDPAAEAL